MAVHFKTGALHPNTPHLFADLVELFVLISPNTPKAFYKSNIATLIKQGEIHTEELDEVLEYEQEAENHADVSDRLSQQADDIWSQIEYRENAFQDFYPFKVESNCLKLKDDDFSDAQKLYILMLTCSRLRSFDRESGVRQYWAKSFTNLSKEAMVGLTPIGSDVKIFDANSDDRRNYYGTNLRQALVKLGEDLSVINILEDECNKEPSSGDGGLDIVAIYNFKDNAVASHAIFGQCGAQETEWPKKTLEATPEVFSHLFQFQVYPSAVMFTPVCYRNSDGSWVRNRETNKVLLLDRYRILNLINQESIANIVTNDWFTKFFETFEQITEIER